MFRGQLVGFGVERNGGRLLFGVVLLVFQDLVRVSKLIFNFVAFVNLSNPFHDDRIVGVEPAFDDELVFQFVFDGDESLVCHVVVADNVNISLVEELERRSLRDDDGVRQCPFDQHGASLAVA
jgi:hypothetical protein